MPIGTRYVFVASMDVDPDKEDLFNARGATLRVRDS